MSPYTDTFSLVFERDPDAVNPTAMRSFYCVFYQCAV